MSLCRMCGGPVEFPDEHEDCVLCLGRAHAEAALEGSDCKACQDLPIKILSARLAAVRSGGPLDPASSPPAAFEPRAGRPQASHSGGFNEGLTSAQRLRRPCTPEPPLIYVEESSRPPAEAREMVSFGYEEDDVMSTSASDPGAWSDAPSEASCTQTSLDAELMNILTEAVADLELDWAAPEQLSKRWMDGSFLGASRQAEAPQRPAPFFPELHEELTRSWRSPHSARAHAQGTQLLTTVEGAEKRGYSRPPPVEDTVAAHLCPSRGWKTTSLPSKPCRATAHIAEKAYISAGHAASALHTMAVLQVFQTRLLRSLDEEGPDPESLRKLRTAADLALAASKKAAQGIGRNMGSLVVLHHHLWLTLTEMRDAEKRQLLDAPVSPQSLFGVAVEAFSEKFAEALKQSKMLPHLLPKQSNAPPRSRSRSSSAQRSAGYAGRVPPASLNRHFVRGSLRSPVSERSRPLVSKDAVTSRNLLPPSQAGSKDGGMRPILDLRPLNRALAKRSFKMITVKQIAHSARGPLHSGGSERCLFSHPGSPSSQALSTVCFRRCCIPIQSVAVRAGFGPPYVYDVHECSALAPETQWNARAELSRRLADHRPIEECARGAQTQASRPSSMSRPVCEHAKEHASASPVDYFSGYGVGLAHDDRALIRAENPVHSQYTDLVRARQGGSSEEVSETPWSDGSCSLRLSAGFAAYEGVTAVVTRPNPAAGVERREEAPCYNAFVPRGTCALVRHSYVRAGYCDGQGGQTDGGDHRRITVRLGSPLRQQASVRRVGERPEALAYKLLGDGSNPEKGFIVPGEGHHMAPQTGTMGSACVASQYGVNQLTVSQRILYTITEARAPSTRRLYGLKWKVFANWCASRHEDPISCDIPAVLTFLQERLDAGVSLSTLKVYVAAIAASHNMLEGRSVGKHPLVSRFLRGARRLNPSRPRQMPVWDLSLVLRALSGPPFEPAESSDMKVLSFKTALLLALACGNRVGDLHALSVSSACMQFGPNDCMVRLTPRPGYTPKVLSTPFRAQVITIQAFCSSEPDTEAVSRKYALCPVRALRAYVNRTSQFRTSEQLFVCFAGAKKGGPLSKQRLSHWIVEAVRLAYDSQGLVCPIGVRAHSARSLAFSWAWAKGMSIQDICFAAGWSSHNTFVRYYNLDIPSFAPHVLSVQEEKAEQPLDD
ncbi:hypothetical protein M9458_058173 [Cirrhinus mrigala]|uniref:Tyr recombinase domain-containing protein n=1 Tax=Cirrhinus mrigala TaxID=683832 RepID=A0ABD0MCC5_CIRMR